MSKWLRYVGVVLALVVLGSLPFWLPQASSQVVPPSSPPIYSPGPVTDYQAALPNSDDVLRFRRGERYNSPNSPLPELGEDSDSTLVVEDTAHYSRDPMPFALSDAVVVGHIENGQAYLSNDKRDIYTEFAVTIQEVIKAPTSLNLRTGSTIAIERHGGVVRLPSGKPLTRAWQDNSMPTVGKRYVLFLKYNASTEDYRILTGYQLEPNSVYALDDLEEKDRNRNTLVHGLRERAENETKFLERVRAAKPPIKEGK